VNHADADFFIRQFLKRCLYSLGAALHIRFDYDVEVFQLALLDFREQILERYFDDRAMNAFFLQFALRCQFFRHAFVGHDVEGVAGVRDFRHAGYLDRHGRTRAFYPFAGLGHHHADIPDGRSGDDRVAMVQGPVLDQDGHQWAAAFV
jgi:hypothetical protein